MTTKPVTARDILKLAEGEEDEDGPSPQMVKEATEAYKAAKQAMEPVMDFLEHAQPDHALSDKELKNCIDEAKRLTAFAHGLRHISV